MIHKLGRQPGKNGGLHGEQWEELNSRNDKEAHRVSVATTPYRGTLPTLTVHNEVTKTTLGKRQVGGQ